MLKELVGRVAWKDLLCVLGKAAVVFIVVCWSLKIGLSFLYGALAPWLGALAKQETALVVALVTGSISIVSVVVGTIANNWLSFVTKRSEYLRLHREEPYKRLVRIFYDFQMRQRSDNPMSTEELVQAVNDFNQELTLWGSSKAIREWGRWRVSSGRGELEPRELLFGMERVIRQIRKDLGQTQGLRDGDILRLFVNDIDDYV